MRLRSMLAVLAMSIACAAHAVGQQPVAVHTFVCDGSEGQGGCPNGGVPTAAQQARFLAQLLKVSVCMRANGIPDFPDPSGGGLQIQSSQGSDLNPNNPTFQNASKVCTRKTGVSLPGRSGLPPGTITLSGA